MARIFEKARRWHDAGTEAYGMTLLLQVKASDFRVITYFRRIHSLSFFESDVASLPSYHVI